MLTGFVKGVLASNISLGVPVALTGKPSPRAPMLRATEAAQNSRCSRRAGVSLRIVVCVKYVPDATGDRGFADDLTV
ncbi:hypothetical protein ACWD3D_24015, partial [Streptomyces sp. NPDC002690]